MEVKLPLCWDLTPNLIWSVRLTQLLLPTWKEPKLLKVKCAFPEDCVSMRLLDPTLSPSLLNLNSAISTDLSCWCMNHRTSLLRSFYLRTACPHHISGKRRDSVSCEASATPCYDRILGLCTQTCCIELCSTTSPIGVPGLLCKSEPFGNKGCPLHRETKDGTQDCGDACKKECDLWKITEFGRIYLTFFFF